MSISELFLSVSLSETPTGNALPHAMGLSVQALTYKTCLLSYFPLSYIPTGPGTFQSLSRAWRLTGPGKQNGHPPWPLLLWKSSFFVHGPIFHIFWGLPWRRQKPSIFQQRPKSIKIANKSTLGVPRGWFCSIFGPFRDPFGHRFFDVFRNSVNSRKHIKTNVFPMILPLRHCHFSTCVSLIFHVLFGTPLGEHFWRPKRRPILQKSI